MFEVLLKGTGKFFLVYSVRKTLFKTYFLVFKNDEWEWISSNKTIPYRNS